MILAPTSKNYHPDNVTNMTVARITWELQAQALGYRWAYFELNFISNMPSLEKAGFVFYES